MVTFLPIVIQILLMWGRSFFPYQIVTMNHSKSSEPETPPSVTKATWCAVRSRKEVNLQIERLKSEGISTLRLGIDCIKFNTKKGLSWYNWLLPTLASDFELELIFDNFFHCPPSSTHRKHSFHEIVEYFIHRHGQYFTLVELWRNPANRVKHDIDENIYSEDVIFTATWAKRHGKKVSLGGIQTIDFEWITKLISSQFFGTIEYLNIDKQSEDEWRTNTKFFERTLRSLFKAKGLNTQIITTDDNLVNFQPLKEEIAC